LSKKYLINKTIWTTAIKRTGPHIGTRTQSHDQVIDSVSLRTTKTTEVKIIATIAIFVFIFVNIVRDWCQVSPLPEKIFSKKFLANFRDCGPRFGVPHPLSKKHPPVTRGSVY
jgi:hypothetical protein